MAKGFNGKRMVSENLIKLLEDLEAKGLNADSINVIENIVDSNGNPRFIEGEGDAKTIVGIDNKYCKWSLSGTHLMLVYAFEIADTTELANAQALVSFELPNYILDKIIPSITSTWVLRSAVSLVASSLTTQSLPILLNKGSNKVDVLILGAFTATATRQGRMQIDLLIDTD